MAINLLNLLEDQLDDKVIQLASNFLGESSSSTKSAIGSILPSLIGGAIQRGSTERGAGDILDMISSGGHDGSIFDNLGSLLGDSNALQGLLKTGASLLPLLLGRKQDSVLDLVLRATGLKKDRGNSLMSMLAPLVIGMIGRHVRKNGLNARGLMDWLLGQRKHVNDRLPEGMGSILGFADIDVDSDRDRGETKKQSSSGGGGGWWRWLLLLLALLLLLWMFKKCNDDRSSGNLSYEPQEVMKNAGANFRTAAGYTLDAAGNLVDAAGNIIKEAGQWTVDAAGNVLDAAGEVIDKSANAIAEGFKTVMGYTVDAAGNLVDGAGNIIKKAGEFTVDAAGNVVDAAGNFIDKSANAIAEGFKTAMGYTADAAGNLVDGAGNIIKKAGEWTVNAAGDVVDAAGNVIDKSVDAVKKAANYVVNAAGDLVDGDGNIIAKKGSFKVNDDGSYSDNDGNVIAASGSSDGAGSADDADVKYNVKLVVDDAGNLVDESSGEVLYKTGEYEVVEGYYVDKEGNKIARVWEKIKEAIADATVKTADAFKSFFGGLFEKRSSSASYYKLKNITFNPENQRITDFSKAEIEGLAQALQADPNATIVVNAYTNDGSNDAENEKLSSMRAEVVKDMLVTLGVKDGQISSKGKSNSNASKAASNTVEVVIK